MNKKSQYIVFHKGRKIYHLLGEPVSGHPTTLCNLVLNLAYDILYPEIPLNKRLCKHCERVRQNEL